MMAAATRMPRLVFDLLAISSTTLAMVMAPQNIRPIRPCCAIA